jgi:ABC-type Fe3+ transport system substrate-binding protein
MKRAILVLALVAVLAVPFLLRPKQTTLEQADHTVVVITPHNEAIRWEFTRGFQQWYRQKTGQTVAIDWRVIGGTSEIARFLESEYISSFENYWTRKLGKPWSIDVQGAFANGRLAKDAPAVAQEARAAFLASDVTCGIDVFFGGGSFDFARQAEAGRLVDSGVMKLHPDWFEAAVIPQSFTGQPYWDRQGRWVGAVLSNYGMIYNFDALARLKVPEPPRRWDDLQDPRLIGEVALCDPTKSSSIAQAFENVIQEQIYREWNRLVAETGRPRAELEKEAVARGWENGLRLLQRIGANARYFTDSSQKPPIDVQQGNSAVGMCIDFYGRAEEQSARERSGRARLGYFSPPAGTVISCDPIALLRGAPDRAAALAFIEYCLSMDGQKLWNFRPGTPGGTRRYALRRLPIRRDFYAEEKFKPDRSDPEINPYAEANPLVYNAAWTGGIFREMAFVIRVMCQDTHPDLVEAWRDIIKAGMPADALAAMGDLTAVSYDQMNGRIKQALNSKNKVDEVRLARELAGTFRQQYRRAAELARSHQP